MNRILLLGKGYVGKALSINLPQVITAGRSGKVDINFNFEDKATWDRLPIIDTVIITFPILNLDLVKKFYHFYLSKCKRAFLYGTTSIYVDKEGLLHEGSPLDANHRRYEVESYLIQKNVNVLTLAGICGINRQPYNWLQKGQIKNGKKVVNLIHLDDIVTLTVELINKNLLGERVNFTAGGYLWQDIAKDLNLKIDFEESKYQNRVISNKKILSLLSGSYKFICPYKS